MRFLTAWQPITTTVAEDMSKKLQVEVKIGSIKIEQSKVQISEIQIANPTGSVQPTAFTCKTMDIETALANYFQQDIEIDEIALDGIYIDFEFENSRTKEGNWSTIMGHANEAAGVKPEGQTASSSQKIHIKRLVYTHIATDLVYWDDKKVQHLPAIDKIELSDISGEGGPDQIMRLVIGNMLKSVAEKQNLGHLMPGGHLKYLLPLRRLRGS